MVLNLSLYYTNCTDCYIIFHSLVFWINSICLIHLYFNILASVVYWYQVSVNDTVCHLSYKEPGIICRPAAVNTTRTISRAIGLKGRHRNFGAMTRIGKFWNFVVHFQKCITIVSLGSNCLYVDWMKYTNYFYTKFTVCLLWLCEWNYCPHKY